MICATRVYIFIASKDDLCQFSRVALPSPLGQSLHPGYHRDRAFPDMAHPAVYGRMRADGDHGEQEHLGRISLPGYYGDCSGELDLSYK